MKFIIAFSCLLAVAFAVDEVSVVRNVLEVNPDSYNYAYELGNGILAQESGSLKGDAVSAVGSFKYVSPEGVTIEESYVADENGFQPSGAHLPVGPEIPILIQRSLEYLAAHPSKN